MDCFFKRMSREWLDNGMTMIIHYNVGIEIISILIKKIQAIGYQCFFIRINVHLLRVNAKFQKIQ